MAVPHESFRTGFSASEDEMAVIARVLDRSESGFTDEEDRLHVSANAWMTGGNSSFGQFALGIAARVQTERYLAEEPQVEPPDDTEPNTIEELERIWSRIDEDAIYHLAAKGDWVTLGKLQAPKAKTDE